MRIELKEIWEFMTLVPLPKATEKGDQWIYELVAGDIAISNLKSEDIDGLNHTDNYDTELLPSIFTFREILWQPNVYTQPSLCIPQLNILKVFCEDYVKEIDEKEDAHNWPYASLLSGLAKYCGEAVNKISSAKNASDIKISTILGELRREAFPIIQFFIFHPKNRKDYQKDALNRLNYAVKIMLTQYNNKYYELTDPYWNVTVGSEHDRQKAVQEEEKEKPNPTEQKITPDRIPTPELIDTSHIEIEEL